MCTCIYIARGLLQHSCICKLHAQIQCTCKCIWQCMCNTHAQHICTCICTCNVQCTYSHTLYLPDCTVPSSRSSLLFASRSNFTFNWYIFSLSTTGILRTSYIHVNIYKYIVHANCTCTYTLYIVHQTMLSLISSVYHAEMFCLALIWLYLHVPSGTSWVWIPPEAAHFKL